MTQTGELWVVAGLLATFTLAGIDHIRSTSPAFDEPYFLHSGVTNLTAGVPKQATANLVLAQNWMALPMLWNRPQTEPTPEPPGVVAPRLDPATRFLFDPANDWRWILQSGRGMILVAGMALAILVWRWSREIFGPVGAVLSLGLFCLSPIMVGNSSLATIDLFAALWFFVASRCCWRLCGRVTPGRILACGVSAGLLAATKISCVLLVPFALALVFIRAASGENLALALPGGRSGWATSRGQRAGSLALAGAGALIICLLTLWACYAPQLTLFRAGESSPVLHEDLARAYTGALADSLDWLEQMWILPAPYVHDLRVFLTTTTVRRAYLGGEYALGGWWYFFPVVWFFKAPLPLLLALVGAVWSLGWQLWGKPARRELLPLVLLIVVYLGASMASGLNIGIRHLLPIFPPLFVLAGAAVLLPFDSRWRLAAVAGLIFWSARELVTVKGQYLSYCNLFAGGSSAGHRWIVDSSYEWGLDLPAFERWLGERGSGRDLAPVYLSYFGNVDLRRFQLGATILLPQFFDTRPPAIRELGPGTYVISATMLHSVYGPLFGPWRQSYEDLYQHLRGEFRTALARGARGGASLEVTMDDWSRLQVFDHLRFTRLCAHLRQREPDGRVTNGMLVFEVSATELSGALDGPPPPLAPADAVLGSIRYPQEILDFLK
jgi:hypothetical protein